MSWFKQFLARRRQVDTPRERGTFVMDTEWERNEELRPERLGPSVDDVPDPIPVDEWRPRKSLGPMPKR